MLQDLCRQYERVRFDVTGIGAGSELRADSHLLRVAFRNIIDNACKYSQEDVEVRMVRMEDGVKVDVLDHGIGIPEDDIKYIFKVTIYDNTLNSVVTKFPHFQLGINNI